MVNQFLYLEKVTQIILSAHTKIDPMTTSTVLRMLQQKGLIQRQEHLTDTRAKTVMLTEEGTEMIKKAIATVEKFDTDFFSLLGDQAAALNKHLIALLGQK